MVSSDPGADAPEPGGVVRQRAAFHCSDLVPTTCASLCSHIQNYANSIRPADVGDIERNY